MAIPPREQRLYSGRRLREIVALPNEVAQLAMLHKLRRRTQGSQPLIGITGLHGTGEGEVAGLAADHLPRASSSRTQEVFCGHPSASIVRSAG